MRLPMTRQILLQNGNLLVHDEKDHVIPTRADLLIENDRIKEIRENIEPSGAMLVIDCSDKIVSPGFIDTHHHLWQSQQKGMHCDQILLDYYHSGNLASSHYSAKDIFLGELGGALELLDAGTTTVVDHAHLNYTPEHSKEALRALVASGVRAVFCYCAHPRVETWHPELQFDKDMLPDWVMETFKELSTKQPFGPNGRVRLGFAIDPGFCSQHELKQVFAEARSNGAHLITSHGTKVAMLDMPSTIDVLAKSELLGPDVLISHANATTKEELSKLKESGVHLSSTPITEMQMGHGHPLCLMPYFNGLSSLGVDCHSVSNCFLPNQMITALQASRARIFEQAQAKREWDATVGPTVENAYNLGTIFGARAAKLDHEIGSLKVGKKADIIIFSEKTPTMVLASACDPVAAIVLHSSVRDVETVIVDGIIRKENCSLLKTSLPKGLGADDGEERPLSWSELASELVQSSTELKKKTDAVDEDTARDGLIRAFLEDLTRLKI
ncbi:Metallo-dependent hydrolase [Aaosphaeria arxii CBS 175.79]|uniref:Metallo-dependent hydrolase n=1 Tax=Aaosphaeria arxii CBS 175.79 TaxID=1450172 RepID=A0A6A5X9M3_9PLEO|nr:Metallo-dependent hydrolase [Aaosphaeria arxii CBS 175.79]KAF2009633.1 Metallo-dependent hydrolase [Aaosphaeria arxii CBS 175.79]